MRFPANSGATHPCRTHVGKARPGERPIPGHFQPGPPRRTSGNTIKSTIFEFKAKSPQIPASGAAAQSARRRRQSPCTTETGRHGGASPSCVADDRQSGSFGTHAHTHDDHERHPGAPAARAVCFPARPGRAASMPYQCSRRAPGIRRSRSPGAPQNPQSANSRRTSRKRLQTRQRHKACANAVGPPVSRKNRQSAFIRRAMDDHGFSRPIPEHPIHALSKYTRRPNERPTDSRARLDEPRKIPNLQI